MYADTNEERHGEHLISGYPETFLRSDAANGDSLATAITQAMDNTSSTQIEIPEHKIRLVLE